MKEAQTLYYAHSLPEKPPSEWQGLREHLVGVAERAKMFAEEFGAEELAYVAGLLHDTGKYSDDFQGKLRGKRIRVDHSTAGAKEAKKRYKFWQLISYAIAGHHAGLTDFIGAGDDSSLDARLNNDNLPDYGAFEKEIVKLLPEQLKIPRLKNANKSEMEFACYMLIRMIYSCLVDADFLDTEMFYEKEKAFRRENKISFKELEKKLMEYLASEFSGASKSVLNVERTKILNACLKKAGSKPGFYTLTVPTGGGKTFSSLAFALKHAVVNGLKRVVYVIPYTSIIEQNAKVFRDALGEECVLEHHSNYDYKEGSDNETENEYKMKLAAENWDMPVIATTNVQFFESLFSNRPGRCRKLHNIVNSVIIFDEAQMLPTKYLKLCICALGELIKNYNCSVVFCTATQPALFDDPPEGFELPEGMRPLEIIENHNRLYNKLRAVKTKWIGELKNEKLGERIAKNKQALCVVNTRKMARELYDWLKDKGKPDSCYHLSAAMCPAHRADKIAEIKNRLKNKKRCIVVSTQLIEAGVDIDFPVVYRELAGIDSIAQAAGRCNRERKIKKDGKVFVFKPVGGKAPPGFIARTAGVTNEVLSINKGSDVLSLKNIKYYFEKLYSIDADGLDGKNILRNIKSSGGRMEYPFRTISDDFNLIDKNTYTLVIRYDSKSEEILNNASFSLFPWSFARKLQRYTVQVYKPDYDKLLKNGKIRSIKDVYSVVEKDCYSPDFGVNVEDSTGKVPADYII
ncbi:MAG: CRISPR-associated helicase Cas3' [Candidatus Margulisiibacteriota bacterium]|nr:CRISPR-associated helicase Cas3' [Candidatus Margulisiibacteriota bacterium]